MIGPPRVPQFLVFAVCAFASGFALRIIDPLILPIADAFAITPAMAALLSSAYALPYAIAQPFLGPLGDRFGKARCIQVCVAGMTVALLLGALAPGFELLMATRIAAGVFAGGLIPLVLAGLGDAYDMMNRQVMIGRMLLAIITGQMLGSTMAGLANTALGWRSAFWIAAAASVLASTLAWAAIQRPRVPVPGTSAPVPVSFLGLYRHVFDNPKAVWLYAAVIGEGLLVFGVFPYMGPLLIERVGSAAEAASAQAGLALGAFGIGGLVYAALVRRIIGWLGVRRMCLWGSSMVAALYAALAVLPVWWLYALAMAGVGLSYYMLHNSLQTEATELAPAARGSAVALFACGFFGGQGLGPPLFGAVAHTLGSPVALMATAAGLLLLGQLVVRRIID